MHDADADRRDFEALRGDLISYLAGRFELSPETVLKRLGDLLLDFEHHDHRSRTPGRFPTTR